MCCFGTIDARAKSAEFRFRKVVKSYGRTGAAVKVSAENLRGWRLAAFPETARNLP